MKYQRPSEHRRAAGAVALVKVTFLGTGAGNFRGDRRHMSSAFVDGLLLDCGAGATGRLYDAGLFEEVDAVLITHLHTDHIAGLFDFLLHTLIVGRTRPLTIVTPPGLSPILTAMNHAGAMARDVSEVYPLRLVEATEPETTVGPWKIRGVPLHHTIYNVGYVVSRGATTLYYTGDTMVPSFPEGLRADVVIHEATYAEDDAKLGVKFGHSTAAQAALAARTMGAKRLFLTHIGGRDGTEAAVGREARAVFSDAIVVEDTQRYDA
jgi:ribonuclease Z